MLVVDKKEFNKAIKGTCTLTDGVKDAIKRADWIALEVAHEGSRLFIKLWGSWNGDHDLLMHFDNTEKRFEKLSELYYTAQHLNTSRNKLQNIFRADNKLYYQITKRTEDGEGNSTNYFFFYGYDAESKRIMKLNYLLSLFTGKTYRMDKGQADNSRQYMAYKLYDSDATSLLNTVKRELDMDNLTLHEVSI